MTHQTAPVPDHLLGPLVEAAGDTLRTMDADDVPAAVRHLRGFDRRGLMHGPAPRQLRKAFDTDAAFRTAVLERFSSRSEVEAELGRWSAEHAAARVDDAAGRRDLALLASVLYVCDPPGADFGLGAIVALDAIERRERGDDADARARAREVEEVAEARRRAETAKLVAETEAARASEELRAERAARRARDEQADAEVEAMRRQVEAVEASLASARADADLARTKLEHEARRNRALDEDLRRVRADLADVRSRAEQAPSRLDERDARLLADAVATSERLARELAAMRSRVDVVPGRPPRLDAAPEAPREQAPARRTPPRVPTGVVHDSVAGIEAMLATNGVLLVIDGYNVTKHAWGDESAEGQRQRLGVAVTALQRRVGCDVLCVFDGDGTGSRPMLRRGGVRVMFSDAGEEADDVIVREVAALPKRVPVVVVSSDGWIREHAVAEGAVVVGTQAFLSALRRD
jgi:predicted RNA-binding protein with PIN domain